MKSILKTIKEFLELEILSICKYNIMVSSIVFILAIILFTKILLWLIKKALDRHQQKNDLDAGKYVCHFSNY